MKRALLLACATAIWSLILAPTALAAKPSFTCPAEASGFIRVDRNGWWDRTVDGFEQAGISVYEADDATFTGEFNTFAQGLGFLDGADLENYVRVTQWAQIDRNANDYVCMKDLPNTPGSPGYIFNGVDDEASTNKSN